MTLATAAPLRLPGWAWRGWERDLFGDRFLEAEDRGPSPWPGWSCAGRSPATSSIGQAGPVSGRPNLVDATTAVAVVVGSVNHTAGPVLAAVEAGG